MMIQGFHPDRKGSFSEQKCSGQRLSISTYNLKVMKSCPHKSPWVFWLSRAWTSLRTGRKSMGSHCLKKQQTKEMSQIFANIRACTRLLLNSHEKAVRQRSETYTEIRGCTGKGSARHGTSWPSAVITAIALHKGMMPLESFEQDCLRVMLKFTWQNYLHTQERKR